MPDAFKPLTEERINSIAPTQTEIEKGALVHIPASEFSVLCDMALCSLALPLPGCGHPEHYSYSADGGQHIICLLCEHERRRPEERANDADLIATIDKLVRIGGKQFPCFDEDEFMDAVRSRLGVSPRGTHLQDELDKLAGDPKDWERNNAKWKDGGL